MIQFAKAIHDRADIAVTERFYVLDSILFIMTLIYLLDRKMVL